jgi:hypothetical protein
MGLQLFLRLFYEYLLNTLFPYEKEMSTASAVRSSETVNTPYSLYIRPGSPCAFKPFPALYRKNSFQLDEGQEIINMPVSGS